MSLTKSKDRVHDLGEVYTPAPVSERMIDLTEGAIDRLDTTVLEPACGNGNILDRVLRRKLNGGREPWRAVRAVAAVYGVDIDWENVWESRARMLEICRRWSVWAEVEHQEQWLKYVLERNVVQGDTYKKAHEVLFTEWTIREDGWVEPGEQSKLVEEKTK